LSIPRPTNAAGMPVEGTQMTQEQFYAFLEQEMRKIEQFTKKQVMRSHHGVLTCTTALVS
jgi:preprotein translocase subunit SecE